MAKKQRSTRATSPERLRGLDNRAKALELRKQGHTYDQIAIVIGVSKHRCWEYVKQAMDEIRLDLREEALQIRAMEAEKLDALQQAHWLRALRGNIGSTKVILQVMERRARLIGLDSPIKIAPTDPGGENRYSDFSDEDLLKISQSLVALNKEEKGKSK